MNIRDSESSTDDELPELLHGRLGSCSGAATPTTSNMHVQPMANMSDTTTVRSGIAPSSAYESAHSSIFSATMTISRPNTPPSPSLPSTFPSQTQGPFPGTASATSSRTALFLDSNASMLGDAALTAAEKDSDDPTIALGGEASRPGSYVTPTALARLLASRATDSPAPSRTASYIDGNPKLVRQVSSPGTTSLHDHLYNRGLLEGKHSDIAVIAFGHKYNLHRLILDRASFFATALSEPWLESQAKEIVLHPEELDPTITQKAFELALKRLYGCDIRDEEDAEAVGLFATGCWLEMQDLVKSAIESILRQMGPETLSPLIKLVTNNYYGRAGDRILASAKAMLCRDGWEMSTKYWDEIPGEIVREIVGGDGFYVPGEWDRWILAKRLLDRRLREKAAEHGLAARAGIRHPPEVLSRQAIRQSSTNQNRNSSEDSVETQDIWTAIYTDPDVEPILVLMDYGIHYVHFDFEQLQCIRQAKDILGISVLPEHIITDALWQQMELRQRVVNARQYDLELGLSHSADPQLEQDARHVLNSSLPMLSPSQSSNGKQKASNTTIEATQDKDATSNSPEGSTRSRRFWIPSADCNIVMGGNAEPVVTTNATSNSLRSTSGMPASLDATDVLWASSFAGTSPPTAVDAMNRPRNPPNPVSSDGKQDGGVVQSRPVAYSNFPPFRFSAEFPNPRSLKEKKRVYSRTVFYAGSHWNIYIQKVRSQKNPQLGVYLHRAKERESEDNDTYLSARLPMSIASSVDERIGFLEREMLLRSSDGRTAGRRRIPTRRNGHGNNSEADDGTMAAYRQRVYGADANREGTVVDTSYTAFDSGDSDSDDSPSSGSGGGGGGGGNGNFFEEQAQTLGAGSGPSSTHFPLSASAGSNTTRPSSLPHTISLQGLQTKRTPTLPPYTDTRPTIKTYFKIYSPSKGGRLLSVYESAPDKFDFSQSWGWKSSTLMLDDGFSATTAPAMANPGVDVPGISIVAMEGDAEGTGAASGSLAAEVERERRIERETRRRKEGVLRFTVVIGNL